MIPKTSELRRQRTNLLDESRVMLERSEKDNRPLTADEQQRHLFICGDGTQENPGEAFKLAQRISTIERQAAVEAAGPEPATRHSSPLPHEDPSNNRNGKHKYSILRAAKYFAEKRAFAGIEAEVSQELAKRSGKSPLGFLMPYRTFTPSAESRALDSNAGGGSIPTELESDWIDLLRNKMVVKQAGMREVMDLVGKFAIPRQNAAATAYWLAESGAPTGSNQTLDQVLFTPHTIGAFTDISRRFFELTILDSGEEFVKEDLTAILARGIDLAALNGTGGSNQPMGILQNTAITATRTVSLGANGGPPTWAQLIELYTVVSRGNAGDLGEFCYVGNADVEGTCASTAKISSTAYPIFLLEDGKIYSKRFLATQQLPNTFTKGSGTGLSPIVAGIFNQLVAGYWSGVDMLVDPYTGSSTGTVRIVALQDMDIQVRHNEAFAVTVDMQSNQTQ
jgi:HK97 family phage major capsid protein